MITGTGRIGSVAGLAITLLLGSCSQQPALDQPPAVADILHEIVARVNGVAIDRQAVLRRLEQARSMMAHQQHDPGMDMGSAPTKDQPAMPSGTSSEAAVVHRQDDPEHEKAMLHTIINQMILEQLKLQEGARLGLSVSTKQLDDRVKMIEEQSGSPEALDQQLRQGHTAREEWQAQLHQALLFQELEARRRFAIPVSDEDIRLYWDQNRKQLAKLWKVDRLEPSRDRIRTLIQTSRWQAEEAQWYEQLVRDAKIWVDPEIRQALAKPPEHTHPDQAPGPSKLTR